MPSILRLLASMLAAGDYLYVISGSVHMLVDDLEKKLIHANEIIGKSILLDWLFGSAMVNLDKLGTMTLTPLALSVPDFSPENFAEAFANPIIAEMPVTVMAGVLLLVGAGLINLGEIKKLRQSLFEYRLIFVVCLATSVYGGIDKGVFLGTFLSIVSYLRSASKPEVKLSFSEGSEQSVPTKLKEATVLEISGSIFFGSLHIIDKILTDIGEREQHKTLLIIVGEYLQHLDAAGAEMLVQEAKKRQQNGYQLELWLRDDRLNNVLLHIVCQKNNFTSKPGRFGTNYFSEHL